MNPRDTKIRYIPGLDGLRGMAILLVMLFHTGIPSFRGGFTGVDIFFVLSGFLITSLLLSEASEAGRINLKYFYMRRILRLLPALVLMLAVVTLTAQALKLRGPAHTDTTSSIITLFYSANWVRAFNLHQMGLLSHTWSLSIEEQFYMLWPLVLIIMLRYVRREKRILNIVLFLSVFSWFLRIYLTYSGHTAERIFNGLDSRADALLTGCAAAIIRSTGLWTKRVSRLKSPAYAGFILPLVILFNISWSNHNMFFWVSFLLEFLTAVLILHIVSDEKSMIKKFLTSKPLVWVGSISYGVYLWHDPVFEVMRYWGYSKLSILFSGSIITLGIASVSYYLMEKPLLRLKKSFQVKTTDFTCQKPPVSNLPVMVEDKNSPLQPDKYFE
ncbi:MAG: acyltransferase [Ignavibacteria bacterium]|jgi:peptidoglycan/LPS O-acetylase OafA/YrhL|nr:acyltransferase [Ignavibacteria bacterium]